MPFVVAEDNQYVYAPLFITGTTSPLLFGGRSLFLKGYPRYRQNIQHTLFIQGGNSGYTSGNFTLFTQGGGSATGSITLYVAGYESISGLVPLYVEGGRHNTSGYIPMYIRASTNTSDHIPLSVSGLRGYNVATSVLYLAGPTANTSNYIPLFVRGD